MLCVSAVASWTEPARIAWPSYTDGVPNLIAHPSDLEFRLAAALLGAVALSIVGLTRRGVAHPVIWLFLAVLGLAGVAVGLDGFRTVAHHYGFGSRIANDMTLPGFRHGLLNYVELTGAGLLCLSPLAALRASRSVQ